MTYVILSGNIMQNKRVLTISILFLLLITAIIFVGIMAWWLRTNETNEYEHVEIREYEGQDLSSINNFRENSISGPQYVDNETYKLTITGLVNNGMSRSPEKTSGSSNDYLLESHWRL